MYPFDLIFNGILNCYEDLTHYLDNPEIILVLFLIALLVSLSLLKQRR